MRRHGAALCGGLIALVVAHGALAQTHYYNLDGGRPGRVEDAEATARYALDVDFGSGQFEHLSGGTNRFRAEPKLSYGVLPFTEIEARLPLVRIDPPRASGAKSAGGIAGFAVGALHAFNLETSRVPALALAGEVSLPFGALAAPQVSYLFKALATKTMSFGRFHLNGGGGSYSVRVAAVETDTACTNSTFIAGRIARPGDPCNTGPPIIIDTPCNLIPDAGAADRASFTRLCMGGVPDTTRVLPRSRGNRWFAGAGFDHAFALQSTLLMADLYSERFVGLYSKTDWTAELGVRRQLTPMWVIDAGAGWHFAGTVRSVSMTLGASYEIATPSLRGR